MSWHADIITYVPEMYPGIWQHALLGKALEKKLWSYTTYDIKQYADQLNCRIDDKPFGGGAGMVMRPDVAQLALDNVLKGGKRKRIVIYPSASGEKFNTQMAKSWSKEVGIVFLCGRFEGIDQRIIDALDIFEVSIGDFILCGGDSAVQIMVEATLRYVKDVLGNDQSAVFESFEDSLLEHPHYTRPFEWGDRMVPSVLTSGDHQKIDEWRFQMSIERTKKRRPDLWKDYCLQGKSDKK